MTKIAVAGVGRWGKNLVRELNKLCSIKICYNRKNEENQKWLKENYPNIKSTTNYGVLLADKELDAIVISTPIASHFALARDALNSGKHVFVEKPMTNDVSKAKKLIEIAKKKGLILFVGQTFLYHPIFTEIRKIARKEPVKYAKFVWNKFGTFGEDIVWNLVIHDIAMANELFGMPKRINVTDKKSFITKADILSLSLEYNGNRKCIIDVNRVSNTKRKSVNFTTSKNAYLWENDSLYKLNRKTNEYELVSESKISPLEVECQEFIRCIKDKKKPYTNGLLGMNAVSVAARTM